MSETPPHPAVDLDDVIHQRVRLGVLVMLAEIPECAFSTLRAELRLTDGYLNRHLQVTDWEDECVAFLGLSPTDTGDQCQRRNLTV